MGLERDGQAVAGAAVGEKPLGAGVGAGTGEDFGEDHGPVVAAQEVALAPAQRHEGELGFVAAAAVGLQLLEEEGEEPDVCN